MMIQPLNTSDKITPACSVFGQCGGCSYQDMPYTSELHLKQEQLKNLFADHLPAASSLIEPIVASPQEYHYRHRLDMKLIRTRTKEVFMGFSPVDNKRLIEIDSCPIARKEVSDFLPQLKIEAQARLTDKYREANLVVRTSDDSKVLWGGVGRRSLQLAEQDYLWTQIKDKKIFFSLDTFFQANLFILPKLFERLEELACWDLSASFYDLYGGVGLFAIGLQHRVAQVFLIEEHHAALKLARYNIEHQPLKNIHIINGRVEDKLADTLAKDLNSFKVAMIDPPRAGLSPSAVDLLKKTKAFNHLLYLSCNPETQVRDLKEFVKEGWKIKKVIPFDFFPRTKHLETLVLLNHTPGV